MKNARLDKPFAKKSLGQNFLSDQNVIERIIKALDPQTGETVVEIGPGRGALTKELAKTDVQIIAVELDAGLIPLLNNTFADNERFRLIEKNALETDFRELLGLQVNTIATNRVKLVANLPYYISTAILQHLIEYRNCFSELVLMLQNEVVERITAKVGTRDRGYLTVLIEAFFSSEKLFEVSPQSFRPVPKVQSAVIRLRPKEENLTVDEATFRQLVSAGFRQKRKTILNNFKNAPNLFGDKEISITLAEKGIDPQRRAEDLTLEEWFSLVLK